MTINASEIQAGTHVWIRDSLVYVANVRETITGAVSINDGERLLAADMRVTPAV